MKRRFANQVEGIYIQKRIDDNIFNGYACYVELKNVEKPLIVYNGINNVCIKDNDYKWIEVYPDNENYAITIMYDDKENLIEWYFDIAKQVGIENNIPYEDDLYLDVVVLPNGEKLLVDEDELLEAYNSGKITKNDVDLAHDIVKKIENKYINNYDELIKFTNYLCEMFNINFEYLVQRK